MTGNPVQKTNNAENVNIWWRHHDIDDPAFVDEISGFPIFQWVAVI